MYDSAKHYDDRAQHSMNTTVGEHPDTDKLDLMNTRAVKSQGESRTDMYYTTRRASVVHATIGHSRVHS